MRKALMSFASIFKDDNDWNEKSIIGFISFAIMVIVMGTELAFSITGKNLPINHEIYSSFVTVTLGSFGIAGIEKVANAVAKKKEKPVPGNNYDDLAPPDEG